MKKLPKAQLGAIIKGILKYGMKGAKTGSKIGARAAEKNKALTKQAKRLIDVNKRAPGTISNMVRKETLKKVKDSETIQLNNLLNKVSKVERTRAFNKDLKKVGLVSGGLMGGLGIAAKYVSDKDKKKKKK